MLPAILATFCFSISTVCGHRSAKLIGGSEANFWRLLVATLLLAAWAHLFGQGLGGAAFPIFLLSGLMGIGVGDVAYFQALPRLGSRLTSLLLQCLTTPFAALIEWVWLGTRLTPAEMMCDGLILSGVCLALAPSEHLHRPRRALIIGVLCNLVAAFGNALGMVLSRKAYAVAAAAGESIDGPTAAYQRLISGLLIAGVSLLIAKRQHLGAAFDPPSSPPGRVREKWRKAGPWVVANSLAGMTIGVSFLQWALKTTPTGIVLPIVAITPLVVIPFARRLENERAGWRSLAGGVIAVCGAVVLAIVSHSK